MKIENAGTSDYGMHVSQQGRGQIDAVTTIAQREATERGQSWNLGTGYIDLQAAATYAMMYLKNTTVDKVLAVELFVILTKPSTGAPGVTMDAAIVAGIPDSATIVTSGTALPSVNQFDYKIGSAAQISSFATVKAGTHPALSFGTVARRLQTRVADDDRLILGTPVEVDPGGTVGIELTTATGNTTMLAQAIMEVYVKADKGI